MMSYPLPVAIAALLALSAMSCAREKEHEVPSSDVGPAVAVTPASVPTDDDDEVEPTGALVIRDDVVKRCPALKKFQAKAARDDDAAVDAIRAMGECMTRGGLRAGRLVVVGGTKGTKLFHEALGRVGVAEARVEKFVVEAEEADRRVEVGLTKHPIPGAHEDLVLAVRKSQVVGFLIAGGLDD